MITEKGNQYLPRVAVITAVKKECKDIYTFRLRFRDRKTKMDFMPGQFLQVMVLGVGEVPISISSSPYEKNFFEISVKRTGCVTEALFRLKKGDAIGIRGPYGNWYPMDSFKGKDLIIIAGGVGIAPLGAVIEYIIKNREDYGKVWLLYGTHCPANVIFKERMKRWHKNGIESIVTVSNTYGKSWKGDIGYVEPLFGKYKVKADVAICCGPTNMLRDVYEEFKKIGIADGKIYFSLERMMQCGIGKCGHCNIGSKYVCVDGPVFRKDELDELTEKIW
jgi:sulfhydrogenase subunit gamma (sulfur reductase)